MNDWDNDPFTEDETPAPVSRQTQQKPLPETEGVHDLGKVVVSKVDDVTFKTGPKNRVFLDGYKGGFIADPGIFKVGQVHDSVKVKASPSGNAQYPWNYFHQVTGAKPAGSGGGFGGGGGRSNWQPKTAVEVHGSNFAGIIKSGIESSLEPDKIKPYLTLYMEACAKLGEVKS